jgi:DedD protein
MRERIVGAVVLIALALIILPLLLDFGGEYTVDSTSQIPTRPDISAVQIDQPRPVVENQNSKTFDQLFSFDASRNEAQSGAKSDNSLAEEKPGLTSEGLPKSWILQVASFSENDTAISLKDKLLADGYRAYSRRSVAGDKTVYRVYVGPKILKKDMLDEKKVIDKKYKLTSLVLRFEP